MRPLNPNGDLLRSDVISGFITELIKSFHEMPDVLVILLSQQPNHYDAIMENMATVKEAYICFSAHLVYGIKIGLCVLGFEKSSTSPQ